jgi:RsiW-degrading membrane proteinase PrsW (M82 family)
MRLVGWLSAAAGGSVLAASLLSALVEELAKALPLLVFWKNSNFDNGTDGIVYGATVGFGFGMTENALYFLSSYLQQGLPAMVDSIVIRTLFTATLHALTTGIAGYFLGRIKFNRNRPVVCLSVGIGAAVGLHMAWNAAFNHAESSGEPHLFLILVGLFPILFFALLVLMQYSLREESEIIRRELSEEALYGIIPSSFLTILPYYLRRSARGWIRESVKKSYVELATTLAFHKYRLRQAGGSGDTRLEADIDSLRLKLRDLQKYRLSR